MPGHQRLHDVDLAVRAGGEAVALLGLGGRVGQPLALGQGHPHLDAVGRGDPSLGLDVLPGGVVPLGPDEGEHVALAAVLAHQRRGQADAAAGLEVGGHPEDRRRQQVHLVVDDEAPVAGVEQLQVGVDALAAHREHLVRRDGDRPDFLDRPGVLPDLVLGQARAPDQLVLPLPRAHGVGDEDERGGLRVRHGGRPDQRLAGAAGQHDHARPAVPEGLRGVALVVAQLPPGLVEVDRVRLAVDVPGVVLGRPAELEQRLLEVAALGGVHRDGVVVDAVPEHAGDLLGAQHLLEHRPVVRHQGEAVGGVLLQPQPAVARHRLGDVDEQGVGHRVAAVLQQRVDDLLGVVPGGARVPQPQRRQPVGVHVLGRALELGERCDRLAAVGSTVVVDLEQERLVRLDDEGAVGHRTSVRRGWVGARRGRVCRPADKPGRSPSQAQPIGRTDVIRCTANTRVSSARWSWAVSRPPSRPSGSTTRSEREPWLST